MTAGEARDLLADLLLPPHSGGRPAGSAPIIAHAVEVLVLLSDGRSVERRLDDAAVVKKLRERLAELEYGAGEISDLVHEKHEALIKAYRRRVGED